MEGMSLLLQVPLAVLILSVSLLPVAASVLLYRKSQTEEREAIRRRVEDRAADPLSAMDALDREFDDDHPNGHSETLTAIPFDMMQSAGLVQGPDDNHPRPGEMPEHDTGSEWEFSPLFVQGLDPADTLESEGDDTGFDDDLEAAP